jgi:transcriptional regulator with XRE-family HTH domain
MRKTETKIREWRRANKFSLDYVCDLLAKQGLERRPSAAKVSRIEWGQNVPIDMLVPLEKITGIPAKELRPDLAKHFVEEVAQ